MLDRHRPLAFAGAVAFGLVACSGGSSPQTSASTTTTLVTLPSASTTAPPAAGGTTTTPPSFLPGQVATTVTTAAGATTTTAGRVVSKPSDNVRLGDTGAGVTQIQTALIKQGYAVSADGKFALTGPNDKTAILWDADTGKQLRSFVGHDTPLVRPRASQQLDYEGELVIVIGKQSRK